MCLAKPDRIAVKSVDSDSAVRAKHISSWYFASVVRDLRLLLLTIDGWIQIRICVAAPPCPNVPYLQMDVMHLCTCWWQNNYHYSAKCRTCMVISQKRNCVQLTTYRVSLNGRPLKHAGTTQTFKYLGFLLSLDFSSWSAHSDYICTNRRKLIGLPYRRFYGNNDHSLLELYSVLMHTSSPVPVCDPHLIRD